MGDDRRPTNDERRKLRPPTNDNDES